MVRLDLAGFSTRSISDAARPTQSLAMCKPGSTTSRVATASPWLSIWCAAGNGHVVWAQPEGAFAGHQSGVGVQDQPVQPVEHGAVLSGDAVDVVRHRLRDGVAHCL